jgi:hypothetical protein
MILIHPCNPLGDGREEGSVKGLSSKQVIDLKALVDHQSMVSQTLPGLLGEVPSTASSPHDLTQLRNQKWSKRKKKKRKKKSTLFISLSIKNKQQGVFLRCK